MLGAVQALFFVVVAYWKVVGRTLPLCGGRAEVELGRECRGRIHWPGARTTRLFPGVVAANQLVSKLQAKGL